MTGIITPSELKEISNKPNWGLHNGCLWLECKIGMLAPVFPDFIYRGEFRVYTPYLQTATCENELWFKMDYYGVTWRLWFTKPTIKEMEKQQWGE